MQPPDNSAAADHKELTSLTIKVSADLCRAYQRCTWILVSETGKTQLEIMDGMVRDFLAKHGC